MGRRLPRSPKGNPRSPKGKIQPKPFGDTHTFIRIRVIYVQEPIISENLGFFFFLHFPKGKRKGI